MKRSISEIIEQVILYFMIFLILREWFIPIMMLTNTGYFSLFLLFMLICLVIGLCRWPIFISWPIKLLYITWFIVSIYSDATLTTRQFLTNELKYNVEVLLAGDWILVSDPLRTSLFFILIWMLIYLIQYWVTVRLTIYYFLVLTVFFIATLDTFTEYDGTMAIIKVMIIGLIMTSMLFIKRLMQATNTQKDWTSYLRYLTPIIVIVTVVGVLATMLPKAEPQWPDPVPYLKNWSGNGGSSGNSVSTVGYGDNDETLGGPFVGDSTVVYEIKTPSRQYWRVETKDYYTSKGWVHSDSQADELFRSRQTVPFSIFPGMVEEQAIEVKALQEHKFLLQAYGTTNYRLTPEMLLKYSYLNEKVIPVEDDEVTKVALDEYSFIFRQPEYSYTQLKEVTTSTEDDGRYLQLPEQLPSRVIDLAHEIADSYESVYDKARAIEDYFKRSGFKYETTDVQVPASNEDYVDQFLFETKLGYCDNFSTSMVVLLRSVGIQSRWVKGFASGERVLTEEGIYTYEVTNNDAHSWVEAYIDGIGWMPFEPTIGFSNPQNIDYDIDVSDLQEEQLPELEEQPKPELEDQQKQNESAGGAVSKFNLSKLKGVLYVLGVVVIIAVFILWKKRGKWQPKLVVQMNRSKLNDPKNFEDGYLVLLKQLERIYLKRGTDETLQQFAKRVDKQLNTTKMTELTVIYEQVIYAGNKLNYDTTEVKESWEYLINRTIS